MATLTVYGSVADGYLWGQSGTYSTARSIYKGGNDQDTVAYVGQDYWMSLYNIHESFFKYDTSSLSGATVTAVQEKLYVHANSAGTAFTDQCRSKDWGESLTSADWVAGDDLSSLTLLSSLDVSLATSGIVTFPSSSNFVAAVNTEGYTYTLHCSSRHVAGDTPLGGEFIGWGSADYSGTDNDPRLYITYETGPHGSGAAQLSSVQVRGSGSVSVSGSGAVAIGAVRIDGSGVSADITGAGAVTIGSVAITGAGERVNPGVGAAQLAAVRVAGQGTVQVDGAGALSIGFVQVSGQGTVNIVGTGAVTIGSIVVGGAGDSFLSSLSQPYSERAFIVAPEAKAYINAPIAEVIR